ncbi:MAG TPA: hypothetical protein VFR80_08240, partial [Pyrinomonadaceae bacterium]|nr:hypothetical protein [Pyrinomonadaceae bacterium]
MLTTGTWLVLIGAALMVAAGVLNFVQRARRETPPWDGIRWTETQQGIIAETVEPNSSGARSRLLPGDRLIAILSGEKYQPIVRAKDVQIYLEEAQVGGQIHYLIERPSFPEESRFYYADLDNLDATHKWTPRALYINLIGLVYLFVGFFVLFKQGGRAPFALHFAILCLTAFVLHFYTPVGTYRDLDLAIAFFKNAALVLFPALLVHFCALYPLKQQLFAERRRRTVLLYVPAIALLLLTTFVYLRDELAKAVPAVGQVPALSESFVALYWRLCFFHLVAGLIASAVLVVRTWVKAKSAVVRQQMKWVVWGSLLAIAPFTLLYGVGYLFGAQSDPWLTDAAVLPLILIPLAFGYSVIRYRLMDVELVVRRVFVYALTTLSIAMLIGSVVYLGGIYAVGGESFTSGELTLRVVVAIVAMAGIVMLA